MVKVGAYQQTSSFYNDSVKQKEGQAAGRTNARTTGRTQSAGYVDQKKETQLSDKAQALLKKLRSTYSNMDFMVADFDNGDEAKEILSRGTKEASVLFTSEELEKMASNEKYEKEYMDRVQGALRMSEKINEQFGFGQALGNNAEGVQIARVGISFNKDGSVDYFAELEKSSGKRAMIQTSSKEELLKKIAGIDWDKIKEESPAAGGKINYSI